MKEALTTTIGLIDDHTLFRKGLISLLESIGDHMQVVFEADNGLDLQTQLSKGTVPDLLMMDVNMPGMDGFATMDWLNAHHPGIDVLVVSMIENEESIIRMLKLGVKGYISKDVEPEILAQAISEIRSKGFYYTDFITGKLVHTLKSDFDRSRHEVFQQMNDREKHFLELACSEMTYNEIAAKMFLSPKTIDGYRNSLFEKLGVKSRVGLALYAVKHGLVKL